MRPILSDLALLHDSNHVSTTDCAEPVSDDHHAAATSSLLQSLLDLRASKQSRVADTTTMAQ